MIVLHGGWLPHTERRGGAFFVWGEDSNTSTPSRRGIPPRALSHPFQASVDHLLGAIATLTPSIDLSSSKAQPALASVHALLPSSGHEPLPSPALARDISAEELAGSLPDLRLWKLSGLSLRPVDSLALLTSLPQSGQSVLRAGPAHTLGEDLEFWSMAAKFALELLAGQRILPGLVETCGSGFRSAWLPSFDDHADRQRLEWLIRAMPPSCRGLGVLTARGATNSRELAYDFLEEIIDTSVRRWLEPPPPRRGRRSVSTASRWVESLLSMDPRVDAASTQLATLYGQWQAWMEPSRLPSDAAFRICFRLEPPVPSDAAPAENEAAETWAVRFFLQATDEPSLLVPARRVWREGGNAPGLRRRLFDQPQERLLAGLGLASRLFPPLERGLRSPHPEASQLTVHEAYAFLREAATLFEQSGFGVLVPPWWSTRRTRMGVRARVSSRRASGAVSRGILSMESIVQYDWQLLLGEERLTWAEFSELAALKAPLVQYRGQWVELDPAQVEATIRFWEGRGDQEEMPLRDALRIGLGESDNVEGLPITGVDGEGWFAELCERLRDGRQMGELTQPRGFVGQLRPYQIRGFSWLAFLRQWGLGACLADDMGLGKTIQTIALWLHDKERGAGDEPVLLVCPTSVVGNWHRELGRFSPGLRALLHHGADRTGGQEFLDQAVGQDIVITSYALVRQDEATLRQMDWGGIILDEAQNIKNPSTRQAQAVRGLKAEYRVALTGTPVENRLSELWSIMEFLNPGYLGSQKGFRSRFALPIERYQEKEATRQLQALVQPFVLRRLKTDSRIIQDLPEKMELKVYCTLTPEQATLYEAVVRDSLRQVEESEGIQRRGIVLATLLKLKQVCNHPVQLLGDGSALSGRSGKLNRLTEMLEEVLSVEEKALVFTQFAEMGRMLKRHLQEALGTGVLFLHGGTQQRQRDRMVDRFQKERRGPSVFVLSLKAGGLGLNLTGANHVFHFDRWWNPAVENQATDRAFRIGQTRDVFVHKFICAGTLEERIDGLIESKKELAEMVIGTGEGWLTELSTDELRDLVMLQGDRVLG